MRDQSPVGRDTGGGTRATKGRGAPRYAIVAQASAAGILFPLSIVAGYLLGKWIGSALGLGLTPAFIGAALGVVAGFWNLYRLLRLLEGGGRR